MTYDIKSQLQIEQRQQGLETFIPEDFDMNYQFTLQVVAMKADGIAQVIYKRPAMTLIEGETFDSAPVTTIEKSNLNFTLTLSPINEILEFKENKPEPKPAPKKAPKKASWLSGTATNSAQDPIMQFINELHRLALFTGNFDSALDFSPKLPFSEVQVGETWKRTVGYQPQRLKDRQGKSAVQRLDYTFTYRGPVSVGGKTVQRVTAELNLDTDLAEWANQLVGPRPDDGGDALKRLPLRLKAAIEFDLDLKTGHTLEARAKSEGGFKVFLTGSPSVAAFEQNLRGKTAMKLKSLVNAPKKGSV